MSQGVKLVPKRRFDWERIFRRLIVPPNFRSAKIVGLTMATYANADGTNMHPGEKLLMAQCGLSERTVRDSLKYLREMGLIHRYARGSSTGRPNYADKYQLCAPEAWAEILPLLPEPGKADGEALEAA